MIGPRARVHFNTDSTVCVIADLMQKRFGIPHRGNIGLCLVSQVVFSVSVATGIKPSILAKHIHRYIESPKISENGYTLDQILQTFVEPIETPNGLRSLTLGVLEYETVQETCDAVLLGYPVIVIIARQASDVMEWEARSYNDGSVQATILRKAPKENPQYHSWLAMGIVTDEDADYLVLRDSRDEYAFKGYLKVRGQVLHDAIQNIKMLSVNVLKDQM